MLSQRYTFYHVGTLGIKEVVHVLQFLMICQDSPLNSDLIVTEHIWDKLGPPTVPQTSSPDSVPDLGYALVTE